MRDFQSEQGLQMHGPAMLAALPCDAFRHAFLGNAEEFKWVLGAWGRGVCSGCCVIWAFGAGGCTCLLGNTKEL